MTSLVGLSEGQPAYTLPPTSLHLDRMVLYQHGPWIDFRARLAEIVATLQHPYSHTPPTLLSYTELHPKPLLSYRELHPKPLLSYTSYTPNQLRDFFA